MLSAEWLTITSGGHAWREQRHQLHSQSRRVVRSTTTGTSTRCGMTIRDRRGPRTTATESNAGAMPRATRRRCCRSQLEYPFLITPSTTVITGEVPRGDRRPVPGRRNLTPAEEDRTLSSGVSCRLLILVVGVRRALSSTMRALARTRATRFGGLTAWRNASNLFV